MEFADHNVLAVYPTLDDAREVILALERAGIEAGAISLLGPGPEEAVGADETTRQRQGDAAMVREVSVGAAKGGALGAAAGAVLGGAAMTVPGIGPVVGAGMLGAAAGGGLFGGSAGAFYGAAKDLPVSGEAWELTFTHVRNGRSVVSVHTPDPAVVTRAEDALRARPPEELVHYDRDGRVRQR